MPEPFTIPVVKSFLRLDEWPVIVIFNNVTVAVAAIVILIVMFC